MPLHIVTSRCFLACEKVTYIKIEELEWNAGIGQLVNKSMLSKAKTKTKKVGRPKKQQEVESKVNFKIMIGYFPISPTQHTYSGDPSECCLEVYVTDKQTATALYTEIVKEIQEQHPSDLFLDKLVNKMLASDEFKIEVTEPE